MTSLKTSKLVGYPWSDLFDLVLDVASYPEFVPYCREVKILSRATQEPEMTIIVSRMTVGFSVFEGGSATRTTGEGIHRPAPGGRERGRGRGGGPRRAATLWAGSVARRAARRGSDRAGLLGGLR